MKQVKTRNWVGIVLILLAIYLMSSILANFASLFDVNDVVINGNVAVIPIKGIITGDGQDSFTISTISSTDIVELIQKAKKDDNIKAIIFEINSPGGSAVASEEISNEISELNKTTVSWIREVGASGAYWAASSTDHIVASRMSATGSIGVLSSYLEFAGLLEQYNVTYRRLVAGKYKDSRSPFKELTKEEENLFQKQLDKVHSYFIDSVAENRNLTYDEVEEFATGQVFLGSEALEIGLIDKIGSKKQAIEFIEEKHNITVELANYEKRKTFFDLVQGLVSNHGYNTGLGMTDLAIKT